MFYRKQSTNVDVHSDKKEGLSVLASNQDWSPFNTDKQQKKKKTTHPKIKIDRIFLKKNFVKVFSMNTLLVLTLFCGLVPAVFSAAVIDNPLSAAVSI